MKTHIVSTLVLAFTLGIATPVLSAINASPAAAIEYLADSPSSDRNLVVPYVATIADTEPSSEVVVNTYEELNSALKKDDITKITLGQDLEGTAELQFKRTITLAPQVVDLNGHNITINNANGYGIYVYQGHLRVTGTGNIINNSSVAGAIGVTMRGSNIAEDQNFSSFTLGAGVTLSVPNSYGIGYTITTRPYASSVTVNGTIKANTPLYINGKIQQRDNPLRMNIGDSAQLIANAENGRGLYAAGYGVWTIGTATITGGVGIAAKSGAFNLTGTTITATSSSITEPTPEGNNMQIYGTAFQIEHNAAYGDDVSLNINGGTYTSLHGDVFYEYGLSSDQNEAHAPADIAISGGTFTAASGYEVFGGETTGDNVEISGGSFSGTDVADFIDDGYIADGTTFDPNTGSVVTPSSSSSSPSSSSSSSTGSATRTYTSADGKISVTGKFTSRVNVDYTITDRRVPLFGNRKYTLFDLNLTDVSGRKATITSPVTVTIQVPSDLDGTRSSIYYVRPDLNGIERLGSTYTNGAITFITSHFSYYAIVEDDGQLITGATVNQSPDGITDDSASTIAPDTAAIAHRGVIGAVATILPLVTLGALATFVYSRIMISRRRAEIRADLEIEAQQIIPEPERYVAPTPVDNFLATPMTASDAAEIRSHIFDRHSDNQ